MAHPFKEIWLSCMEGTTDFPDLPSLHFPTLHFNSYRAGHQWGGGRAVICKHSPPSFSNSIHFPLRKWNWGFTSIFPSMANSDVSTQTRNDVSKAPSPNSPITVTTMHAFSNLPNRQPATQGEERCLCLDGTWHSACHSVCWTMHMYLAYWGREEARDHIHPVAQNQQTSTSSWLWSFQTHVFIP